MLILIAGLAGEGITQPNTNAANDKLVALLNKQAAQLAVDLQRERTKTAARPWMKEQFDAIQDIKGVVKDVGVVSQQHCIECLLLSGHIELALHVADVQLYEDHSFLWEATGIDVLLPAEYDLESSPLVDALKKAGLNPGVQHHLPPEISKIRTDIPVIFVGERFPEHLSDPYSPKAVSGWKILPLAK